VAVGAAAATVDVVRFGLEVPGAGALNILLVWLVPYLLGMAYADRARGVVARGTARGMARGRGDRRESALRRTHEPATRRALLALALGAFAATALLVALGPYPASMIGMPGAAVSNLSPPTLPAMTLAVAQVAALLLLRDAFERRARAGGGADRAVRWLAARSMTVYLWHLTAMVVVVGVVVVGAGATLPTAWSGDWWALRPVWMLACVVVLAALVRMFARFERPRPRPRAGSAAVAQASGSSAGAVSVGAVSAGAVPAGRAPGPVAPVPLAPVPVGAASAARAWASTASSAGSAATIAARLASSRPASRLPTTSVRSARTRATAARPRSVMRTSTARASSSHR